MHPISFFQDLLGDTVKFKSPSGRVNSCKVTPKGVVGLHGLQEHGYEFLKPVVIHNSMVECQSCSA